jgi:hypothetical protein
MPMLIKRKQMDMLCNEMIKMADTTLDNLKTAIYDEAIKLREKVAIYNAIHKLFSQAF